MAPCHSLTFVVLALVAFTGSAEDRVVEKDGLKIITTFLPESCERKTKDGDYLSMHYTGTIDESSENGDKGSKFDSSVDRGTPFSFQLGVGRVIKGWDQGLTDMCIGEKRTLIISPEMGYGSSGAGGAIPGGATLNFEVECLDITDSAPAQEQPNIFGQIDADDDSFLTKEELLGWFKTAQGLDSIPDGLFEHEDKDEDGKISWDEFSGPKGSKPADKDEL
mmetsp:Transcript_853/g.1075  ORF Transcript_853/g.1075 Transcript_853/m.1075 type:complete len:221 (-) Transcript_853:202-864(-)